MKLRTVVICTLLMAGMAAYAQTRGPNLAGFARVIDGDTIVISGVHVRLFGIDAPESDQTCTDDTGARWYCGEVSTAALKGEIGSSQVSCEAQDTDRYGRTVAICFVDGRDVGKAMVRRGWAINYARYSRGLYAAEERLARDGRLGIWKGVFEQPEYWRRTHREHRR